MIRSTAGVLMAVVLWMAGCASPPPQVAAPSLPVSPIEASPAPAVIDAELADFQREQSERAGRAEARGHWAEAAWTLESLVLLEPADAALRSRWQAARHNAQQRAVERAGVAEAALRRGDLEIAAQAYLESLAAEPGDRRVADALRQVERERERRRLSGRNARLNLAARRPLEDAAVAPTAEGAEALRRTNAAREHASLLARQGDLDGAIQLLREAVQARSDGAARAQLADLYVTKGEALKVRQPEAARMAVEAALALDRRHPGALALLRQLPVPAARPAARTPPR